jgi:hypothetical protein
VNPPGYNFWALTGKLLPGLIFLVVLLVYILPNAMDALMIRRGAPEAALVIVADPLLISISGNSLPRKEA